MTSHVFASIRREPKVDEPYIVTVICDGEEREFFGSDFAIAYSRAAKWCVDVPALLYMLDEAEDQTEAVMAKRARGE